MQCTKLVHQAKTGCTNPARPHIINIINTLHSACTRLSPGAPALPVPVPTLSTPCMHQALTRCTSPARPRPHIINTLHAPCSHPVHQPCPPPSAHYHHPACTRLSPGAPALPVPTPRYEHPACTRLSSPSAKFIGVGAKKWGRCRPVHAGASRCTRHTVPGAPGEKYLVHLWGTESMDSRQAVAS